MSLWTPAAISTALWLDGSDATTITQSSGVISQWADKSGNGRNVAQPATANRPTVASSALNGLSAVNFGGSANLYGAISSPASNWTAFFVIIPAVTAKSGGSYMFDCQTGRVAFVNLDYYTNKIGFYGNGAWRTATTSPTTAAQLLSYRLISAGQSVIRKDGLSIYSESSVYSSLGLSGNSFIGSAYDSNSKFSGKIAEIVYISSSLSDDDMYTIEGYLAHKWGLSGNLPSDHPYKDDAPIIYNVKVLSTLDQSWSDAPLVHAQLLQQWGIRFGADLSQRWSDAPVVRGLLSQPWADAGALKAQLVQRWRDMVSLRAECTQPWAIMQSLLATIDQPWAVTGEQVRSLLDQEWSIRDIDTVLAVLHQPWAIAADGSVLRYGVQVLADGVEVGISSLSIEGGLDQDVLTATLELATEADYLRCPTGATLEITITSQEGADTFALVVITPTISQAWGDTRYTVEAMSPAVLLGAPYASGLSTELSGLASAIAATLAGPLTVDWHTVDWPIPPGTWSASGETPLALLKTLAAAVGAVVQSQPDGSLQVRPKALLPAPQWATAASDGELVEIIDCISTGTTPQQRSGYNRFVVSSQSTTATDGLRMESTAISDTVLEVRVYQVPWVDDFNLIHTGGDWAVIEPMGIEQRDITEVVEIVAGGGSCQYPVYSDPAILSLLSLWLQANLGNITAAEDGTITAAIAGESLLELDYTTKCRLYRVHDANTEKLQLVIP